ncbi:nitroreductase family protein [Dethiobacter alkaliphilus]|uniref:nitroreductase family protein n=1 Tax=Dethiobacter alkaliphilus TaxID=427926 RepID=UPI002226CD29|nr:nitroreductase family protein [Dethiobacter alkaliphilus]MCW3489796.1 nitroreductase family protein [Dethiobacter alkaliphilus]
MLPVKRWHQAIESRYSTRNYNGRPVEPEKLALLQKMCEEFRPADSVRAVLVEDSGSGVFKGAIGSYGKIKGNPAYLAFVGKVNEPDVQEMIGYLGEGLILEATALGLNTCWVGGMFKQEAAAKAVNLAAGEQVYALTPVGYGLENDTFEEKVMRGFKTERKRKPLGRLVSGMPESHWPDWVRAGLEAARPAPSAINRQPWRFEVQERQVVLSTDGKTDRFVARRLDCGIAMLHFELGALSLDVSLNRVLLPPPQVARFTLK